MHAIFYVASHLACHLQAWQARGEVDVGRGVEAVHHHHPHPLDEVAVSRIEIGRRRAQVACIVSEQCARACVEGAAIASYVT